MKIEAKTPDEYVSKLPEDRQEAISKLRETFKKNLPKGFVETMSYNMIGYVVPHSMYPPGYHSDPALPLPFINMASQKNYIAIYHSCLYADPELLKWFQKAYEEASDYKLDMGKSCIRFKKPDRIPYELIAELARKVTPEQWIEQYEKNVKR
jgi:hypothetical protein